MDENLNIPSVLDLHMEFSQSEQYKKLIGIGNELVLAKEYANDFIIHDEFSKAAVNMVLTGYFLGVAPIVQLEYGLFLAKGFQIEYSYAINLRAMVELAGRVHKAVRLLNVFAKTKDLEAFAKGCRRLLKPFVKGGGGGYNVISLVESLEDVIPDVMDHYNRLSDYNHGNLMWHATLRKISFLQGSAGVELTAVKMNEDFLQKLREVLVADLETIQQVAQPLIDRYKKRMAEKAEREKADDGQE